MTKRRFIDKVLERINRVDRPQLENYFGKIARENESYLEILDRLDEGILIVDSEKQLGFINSTAERILGISGARSIGKRIDKCLEDVKLADVFREIIEGDAEVCRREFNTAFPRDQLLRLYFSPASRLNEKEILNWMVTVRDITESREQNREELKTEKIKALITMAGVLAHELGNPLNSLTIHIQLIKRAVNKLSDNYKGKINPLLRIAQNEVKRLDGIIGRFLQATRPLRPRLFREDINKILDETIKLMGPEIRKKKIKQIRKADPDLPMIYVDQLQIRQVFINIIVNALEAMQIEGKLEIKTELKDEWVKISFSDSGAGIRDGDFGKVFEPYYTTKSNGSGLGLVIVNRIVTDHGGRIEVKSREGRGTTVVLSLPLVTGGRRLLPEGEKIVIARKLGGNE